MPTFSIIEKSQLEGAKRLDAEYYQPEYLIIQELLSERGTMLLKDVASITTGPAYSSEQISGNFNIPLARIGDVVNKIDVEDWLKISEKEFDKFHNKKVKDLDILLSMTGDPPDVGKCNLISVLANRTLAFNQRTAKITSKINPYYLFVYLSTSVARLQAERNALGIRQRNLGINDLKNTRVFLPKSQSQIVAVADLAMSYLLELQNSKFFYFQAEKLLLEELGLVDFEANGGLWNIVNLSDVKAAGRIDADFFQLKYKKLESKLKKCGSKKLEDTVQDVAAKFVPKPSKIYRYVELADINSSLGVINSSTEMLGKDAPSRARRLLKTGDVIVSSVQGSLGKVALVGKEHAGVVASTGFFQFRSHEILPEVLLVLSKSIVFQSQLEQRCAGTILTAAPKESIKDILVPVLSETIQQKIAKLVCQSHAARSKAKQLLEDAKRTVEELIENRLK